MEALHVTAGGLPVVIIGVFAGAMALATWDAWFSGGTFWVLAEPLGVLVLGVGTIWLPSLMPGAFLLGAPLFVFGGSVSRGYRRGYLPRQPRKLYRTRRQKLPPL
jgi:hypothetical protein